MRVSRWLAALLIALLAAGATVVLIGAAQADRGPSAARHVRLTVLAPRTGDHVGVHGAGWIVDLAASYPGDLASTGASLQLTGPGAHQNAAPFPGTFSPGADPSFPGLVVVMSTTPATAPFHGPGTNLANLFNVTGVNVATARRTEIRDTWIVAAPFWAAQTTPKRVTMYVAVVAGNKAPDVVPDADHDGRIRADDLRALGLASPVVVRTFVVNPVGP